jgi:cyclophilin family peptidyl-prolyl cis-trans isomerase
MNRRRYLRGTLGMALSGPETGGRRFRGHALAAASLDARYAVFGQFLSDADVLDRSAQGDRFVQITIR